MVEVPALIEDSIRRFLDAVRSRYRIKAAYLYGSQAKGTAEPWSDIDVAIVSFDFSDDLFEERVALMHVAAGVDDRIEPHPFRAERFGRNDPVAREIRRHGVKLE